MSNHTGGTARTPEQISEALYPGYNPGGGIREAATAGAREALTQPDFKPAGEHDEYRDAFEQIENETVFRVKVEGHYRDGLTSLPFLVTRDQARSILIMLSAEATL